VGAALNPVSGLAAAENIEASPIAASANRASETTLTSAVDHVPGYESLLKEQLSSSAF
jgi:hypothetical protein